MTDYWRSLGELEGSAEFEAVRHREFPEGASEAPDGISRRSMLGLMGATLSLSGLAACRRPVEKIVPYVQAPEDMLPGVPLRYATTMPFRGNALGLLVVSNEGRPTKVEGNELHPTTQGASNVWAQNAIYELYDPDRSRVPLQGGAAKTWQDFVAAWAKLREEHAASGGEGLAIVCEPSSSPTEARLLDLVRLRFPKARVVVWAPISSENRDFGLHAATGADVEPRYALEQARVILSLDADFLLHDPDQIRLTRAYAAGRRDPQAMNRLYVAESTLTTTGIAADHRLALPSGRIATLTLALAAELGKQGVSVGGATFAGSPEIDAKWVAAVAKDLKANAGKSAILAGAHQPSEVHAAVAALNAALGNVGKTVHYVGIAPSTRSRVAGMQTLAGELKAGTVKTLIILGGNPAYDAPADLELATVAAKATNRIRLGLHVDETSAVADWHLPQAHFLESWGDARALAGPLSVVQPLIEPLFGGHSTIELLAFLESGKETPGYELVRETWKSLLGTDFERQWERALHDGVLAASDAPPVATSADAAAIARLAGIKPHNGLEIVFQPSSVVYDGRYANSAWLQELPEAVSKLTWDNAAILSKTDADGLGLATGDFVTLSLGTRSLTAPVLVLPGQAVGSVAIALGYGRAAAGRVGNGVGFNAYPLRTTTTLGFTTGLTLIKAAGSHVLAVTHEHWSTEGRDIVREEDVGAGKGHAAAAGHPAAGDHAEGGHAAADGHGEGGDGGHASHHPPLISPWEERTYEHGPQWAMTIDLNSCTGCNACVIACQSENNIPSVGKDQVTRGREMHWIRIDRYFSGRAEAPESVVFQPVPCMHCENAPCEQVCPVAATVHSESGLNEMVYNRCIGTRYCSNNCPYKVRRFNFYNFTKDTPETLQMAYNPDVTVRARGVMEKCSYCVQRLTRAQRDAKLAGRAMQDGEARTACQQACPAVAIEFGDMRDPKSRIAASKASSRRYDLLGELNSKPRTSYLSRLRNPNPELSA